MTPKFIHLAIATKFHPHLALLRSLSNKFGLETRFIGYGDPDFQEWGSFYRKIEAYHHAVRDICDAGDGDAVVLLSDSFDFLPFAGPDEIVRRYLSFGADIVYNAEMYCHPWYMDGPARDERYKKAFPAHWNSRFKYLNAGGIVGRARNLLALFTTFSYAGQRDDQYYHHNAFLGVIENPDLTARVGTIALDRRAELFFCGAGSMGELEFDGARFRCKLTGTYPVLLHMNGTKEAVQPIFEMWNAVHQIEIATEAQIGQL